MTAKVKVIVSLTMEEVRAYHSFIGKLTMGQLPDSPTTVALRDTYRKLESIIEEADHGEG